MNVHAGITDGMRANFHLMNALSAHTRVNARSRIEKLLSFNRRLRQEKGIVEELSAWNMKLDDRLVDVPARVLQQEKIVFANNRMVPAGPVANWTKDLHNKALFNVTRLSNWVVVCMNRMRRDAEVRYFSEITFVLVYHYPYILSHILCFTAIRRDTSRIRKWNGLSDRQSSIL